MTGPTQEDVLAKKGYVLRSGLGLQIWGDGSPDGDSAGDASTGTAERQARIIRSTKSASERSAKGGLRKQAQAVAPTDREDRPQVVDGESG